MIAIEFKLVPTQFLLDETHVASKDIGGASGTPAESGRLQPQIIAAGGASVLALPTQIRRQRERRRLVRGSASKGRHRS